MSDFTVYVCYNPKANPAFKYTDESGADASTKRHCSGGKTIKWHLKSGDGCVGSDLKIHFGANNPFSPSTPDPAPDVGYTFNANHLQSYKYNVTITYKGKPISDDPQIEFDDRQFEEMMSLDETLDLLGKKAKPAFGGLLDAIGSLKGKNPQREPDGILFPGGITTITASVTVDGVTVSVTISGPDATIISKDGPGSQ